MQGRVLTVQYQFRECVRTFFINPFPASVLYEGQQISSSLIAESRGTSGLRRTMALEMPGISCCLQIDQRGEGGGWWWGEGWRDMDDQDDDL